jgi:hypothetical protein
MQNRAAFQSASLLFHKIIFFFAFPFSCDSSANDIVSPFPYAQMTDLPYVILNSDAWPACQRQAETIALMTRGAELKKLRTPNFICLP